MRHHLLSTSVIVPYQLMGTFSKILRNSCNIFNIITLKRDMIDNNIYNINVREDNMLVCEICVAVGVRCCAVYVAPCSRGG